MSVIEKEEELEAFFHDAGKLATVGASGPSMKRSASTGVLAKPSPILDHGESSLFCGS